MSDLIGLAVAVASCVAAAAIGGIVTGRSLRDWYPALRKPRWNPPNAVFGPVWSVLYLAMAVAAWLVWREAGWSAALGIFAAQLAINVLWTVAFFGQRRPRDAVAVILALWVAIAATIAAFWPVSPLAAALLLPYLAWVTFASALNVAIARLAPAR